MHYEVQHHTLAHGWKNTWSYDEGDGEFQLETFATRDEAEAALDEFFADLAEDIAAGFCPPCSRDEFRVEFVPGTTTQLNNQPTGERL
jgi:hypothetical protein